MNKSDKNHSVKLSVELSDEIFKKFSDLVEVMFGIDIQEEKKITFYNRLLPRLKQLNLSSFEDYYRLVCYDVDETQIFVNLITNPRSGFFREKFHFDFLFNYLCEKAKKQHSFHIWTVGCSTGEEAYSIAMVAQEAIKSSSHPFSVDILASDIDSDCLMIAEKAVYDSDRLRNIALNYQSYFCHDFEGGSNTVRMNDTIRKMVRFKKSNLIEKNDIFQDFDIIFCRNTIIYFTKRGKELALNTLDHHLKLNGILMLGHSESIAHLNGRYKMIGSNVYQKHSS